MTLSILIFNNIVLKSPMPSLGFGKFCVVSKAVIILLKLMKISQAEFLFLEER